LATKWIEKPTEKSQTQKLNNGAKHMETFNILKLVLRKILMLNLLSQRLLNQLLLKKKKKKYSSQPQSNWLKERKILKQRKDVVDY